MRRRMQTLVLLRLIAVTVAFPDHAAAQPQIMPTRDIHAGQKGYGLSVFSGQKPERFAVEVIGVVKNFLPHQDIILMRGDHPLLNKTGPVAGMSGSPIFIGDRLVGALAYGWAFASEPVFGVTPIENMLALQQIVSSEAPMNEERIALLGPSQPQPQLQVQELGTAQRLVPIMVPLSASGLSPRQLNLVNDLFSPWGFTAVQGGNSALEEGGPDKLYPGSALCLTMIRGDISMHAVGTVTWVQGNTVLAFGHAMFNAGEFALPATTAITHHHLASLAQSFKISSPARTVGALTQDRQAGIVVDLQRRAKLMPLNVRLLGLGQPKVTQVEIARHRRLTLMLARMVLMTAISEGIPDVREVTFELTTQLQLAGLTPLTLREEQFSHAGLSSPELMVSRGFKALDALLDNEFQAVDIEQMAIEVKVRFGAEMATIQEVQVPTTEVPAGKPLPVRVHFRSYRGTTFVRTYTIDIPQALAGSVVLLEVAGGQQVKLETARPQNLEQLLRDLRQGYEGRTVVIGLKTPVPGIKMGGEVLQALPLSVFDALRTGATAQTQAAAPSFQRQVFATDQLVRGTKQLALRIQDRLGE